MGTNYVSLQQELEDAKHTLITLNDNIRKIVGRTSFARSEKQKPYEPRRSDGDRPAQKSNDSLKGFKRRNYDAKSVFNRLSAASTSTTRSTDDDARPRLNSRVIRELPTRQEIVAAQGTDSESRARNRRIFGSLLGTLHKFCQEESRLKEKEDKKAQIERKLEEQEKQERASLKRERDALFLDRKKKQMEIKKLELKMSRLKDFETWQNSINSLRYHIRTNTKPHIYYRPKVLNKKTEKLLSDNQAAVGNLIAKQKEALEKELVDIENEEQFENVSNNEDDAAVEGIKIDYFDEKIEADDTSVNNTQKGDSDAKENKLKSLNGALSSRIVVVKNESQ